MQNTIKNAVNCIGVGIHSGRVVQLALKPAPVNTGVLFMRTDVTAFDNIVNASYLNVSETSLGTTIKNNHNVSVSTIEHLMAAIFGCDIDNIIVEIDGPEIPIMDGSSQPFVFMLAFAGIQKQNAPRKCIKILKQLEWASGSTQIVAYPSDAFSVDLSIDFDSKAIGHQSVTFDTNSDFSKDIASARTFGFIRELEFLKSKGLARGASLDNAIGIEDDVILNYGGLRYENEFARHKLLDFVGDVFTAQTRIIGAFRSHKSGHGANNEFLHKLFSTPNSYELVDMSIDLNYEPSATEFTIAY